MLKIGQINHFLDCLVSSMESKESLHCLRCRLLSCTCFWFGDMDSTLALEGWEFVCMSPEVTCEMFEEPCVKEIGKVCGMK